MNENEYFEMMKEKMEELIYQQRKTNIRLVIIEILVGLIVTYGIIQIVS